MRLREGTRRISAHYRNFGYDEDQPMRGHVRASAVDGGTRFEVELAFHDNSDGYNVLVYELDSPLSLLEDEPPSDSPRAWSGSGTLALAELGKFEVESYGFRDSELCKSEPIRGRTQLRAGGHVAVVSYDGAVDCEEGEPGKAPWTLDGVPMGEVVLPRCAMTSAETRGWPWLLLGIIAAVRARRRGRRDPQP